MKKLFIIFAAALLSISANAQLFVGGRVSLDVNGNNQTTASSTNNYSSLAFNLAPEVGYFISDKLAVGGFISISTGSMSNSVKYTAMEELNGEDNITNFGWSLAPYVKYKFWGAGKFGIWGLADVHIGTSSTKKKGSSVKQAPTVNYGIEILPVLTYSLNEHFVLDAYINCVSLNYNGSCQADKKNDINSSSSSFDLGATTTGAAVSVGVHYFF
ncbi:MAG: hypothetical protein KBS55_01080 [Bacteroidales bacterium]|nr:hypothetical protein [Candidatus Cryptobacteroides aphodequi]